jgi:hypothetical protein
MSVCTGCTRAILSNIVLGASPLGLYQTPLETVDNCQLSVLRPPCSVASNSPAASSPPSGRRRRFPFGIEPRTGGRANFSLENIALVQPVHTVSVQCSAVQVPVSPAVQAAVFLCFRVILLRQGVGFGVLARMIMMMIMTIMMMIIMTSPP